MSDSHSKAFMKSDLCTLLKQHQSVNLQNVLLEIPREFYNLINASLRKPILIYITSRLKTLENSSY